MAFAMSTSALPVFRSARANIAPVKSRRSSVVVRAAIESPPNGEGSSTAVKVAGALAPVAGLALSQVTVANNEALGKAIDSYLHLTAGFVFDFWANDQVPEFVAHWLHPINMGVVLFAMGGYGSYLGWQIRAGNGGDETLTGDAAADLHPKLMAGMTFFFLLGGQGGRDAQPALVIGRNYITERDSAPVQYNGIV